MFYKWRYKTPLGLDDLLMNSDGEYLTGLWFENSSDTLKHIIDCVEEELPIFKETSEWLDIYFNGKVPNFIPKYKVFNLTSFRKEVIDIINNISYGDILTYKDIAKEIAERKNITKMSSQAVGRAVGFNPICIIIPCHRVIGTNKSLTGYGGGINNKIFLLKHEGHEIDDFIIPKVRDIYE